MSLVLAKYNKFTYNLPTYQNKKKYLILFSQLQPLEDENESKRHKKLWKIIIFSIKNSLYEVVKNIVGNNLLWLLLGNHNTRTIVNDRVKGCQLFKYALFVANYKRK